MLPDAEVVIAHNENDAGAKEINGLLARAGLSTFFAPLDELHPSTFAFEEMLRNAKTLVILMGASGLGEMQKMYIDIGRKHGLRSVPAFIGNPTKVGLKEIGELFDIQSIHDLSGTPSPAVMKNFCEAVAGKSMTVDVAVPKHDEPPMPGEEKAATYQIGALIDGNERDKLDALHFIRAMSDGWRARFGARLRHEITAVYHPVSKTSDDSPNAERKERAATRAWLFSALQVSDPGHSDTLALTERSMDEQNEPYAEVRFRVLSGAHQAGASNIGFLKLKGTGDSSRLVSVLARAIANPDDPALIADFKLHYSRSGFGGCLTHLRAMRVAAIPALAVDVAGLFRDISPNPEQAASIFYALCHPTCAQLATPELSKVPGIKRVLELMLDASLNGSASSTENFPALLHAFNRAESVSALSLLRDSHPKYRPAASRMLQVLDGDPDNPGEIALGDTMQAAGYRSDTIATQADRLGIAREVHVLTTLMLSKDVVPPLAIGLFGNWGSGKSFFMHSMHRQAETIAANAETNKSKRFCANIVQIEFNAWHYADTSLWASLVTCIFEKLKVHFTPPDSSPQLHASASQKVACKKEEVEQARVAEANAFIELERDKALKAELEAKRDAGDIPLSAFSMDDVKALLEGNSDLKKTVQQALSSLAIPKTLQDVHSLGAALSEAQSTFGRFTSLVSALCQPRTLSLFVAALLLVVLGIPALVNLLKLDHSLTSVGAHIAQFGAAAAAIATWLRQALGTLNEGLERVDKARTGIEQIVKAKKAELKSPEEKDVEERIANLTGKLQARQDQVKRVESALKEAQDELDDMTQRASLKHFLNERLRTNDYSKHQGLVATVRDDFDRLAKLINEQYIDDKAAGPVERVILYIDDLDRCAAPKVVEVLQAVHLLLAYPLFVVVVGVDARWLMHSLTTHYRQLSGSSNGVDAEWAAKPQHYLEKIFQITYALKPMNEEGFGDLIEELMGGKAEALQPKESISLIEFKTSGQEGRSAPAIGAEPEQAMSTPDRAIDVVREPSEAALMDDKPPSRSDLHTSPPGAAGIDLMLIETAPRAALSEPSMWAEEEVMALQPVEGKFARKLHRFIPSPRAAKRLANIYRILKAGLPRYRLAEFEGTAELPGQFRVPMLLLAILIYDSEAAEIIFRTLRFAPDKFELIVVLRSAAADTQNATLLKVVELTIDTCEEEGLKIEQSLFHRWIPEVSRFSFGMS